MVRNVLLIMGGLFLWREVLFSEKKIADQLHYKEQWDHCKHLYIHTHIQHWLGKAVCTLNQKRKYCSSWLNTRPIRLFTHRTNKLTDINAAQQMLSTHMNNFNSNSKLHHKITVLYNLDALRALIFSVYLGCNRVRTHP